MFAAPRADLSANTLAYETTPLVKATGFREYDARWLFGPDINLLGMQALGLGLGTYIQELGHSKIVVGHDYRALADSHTLTGVWPGQDEHTVLAVASPRLD